MSREAYIVDGLLRGFHNPARRNTRVIPARRGGSPEGCRRLLDADTPAVNRSDPLSPASLMPRPSAPMRRPPARRCERREMLQPQAVVRNALATGRESVKVFLTD